MDTVPTPLLEPQSLSLSNSLRRRTAQLPNSSPEFEFWKVRNPSFPQPNLLSADELFSDGILLPLHLLPTNQNHHEVGDPPPEPESIEQQPISEISTSRPGPSEPRPGADSESSAAASITAETAACAALTTSKRWKDIFKKSEKKSCSTEEKEKGKENKKEMKKERKNGGSGGGNGPGNSTAELNINIWPFSRSRSAGNSASRPKTSVTRKVSSAPCSRSNSAGESKSRKSWPSSPGRGGVHLGRSSPVWQVRRAGSGGKTSSISSDAKKAEKNTSKEYTSTCRNKHGKDAASAAAEVGGGGSSKGRVLNLGVPMCIGYRHHLSCRNDEASTIGSGSNADSGGLKNDGGGGQSGVTGSRNIGNGSNLFTIRSLFAKKVY